MELTRPIAASLHRHPQAGLTLLELMVSMAIGLFLVTGVATLIAQQSSTRAELDKSGRQIENGRYAMTLLQDDIQHAGFYGQYAAGFTALQALPNPCDSTVASVDAALAMPLQGYDAPASVPAPLSTCLPDANHIPGTDILVVRRLEADDTPAAIGSLVMGQIYVQATPIAKITALGAELSPVAPSAFTLLQKDGLTPAEVRKYVQHIYFLSPCNVYAAGATTCTVDADYGSPIPSLKRLEMTPVNGVTTMVTVPLVDGIQNMQLDYGVDNTGVAGAQGDGTPTTPFVTNPTTANWPNVMAVQVNLLVRNANPSGGYVDSKTYSMGSAGTVGPYLDAYKRHAYAAIVRATNPSQQRE
ncbi:MAG: PilW family protein [Candidatus Saccharibacteria bacterium]|nr:PilW family protein [Rhodoferax sp.]